MVFQEGVFFDLMMVFDNVVFLLCCILGYDLVLVCDCVEECFEFVQFVGMGECFLFEFLGGMCRCVGFVCLIVYQFDILFFDEFNIGFDLVMLVIIDEFIMCMCIELSLMMVIIIYDLCSVFWIVNCVIMLY